LCVAETFRKMPDQTFYLRCSPRNAADKVSSLVEMRLAARDKALRSFRGNRRGSEEDAAERAERLEREAHAAIVEFSLKDGIRLLREALRIREASQGETHPDLIWTLSLWIEALRREHQPESAREAAHIGERRLALRRAVLAGATDELVHSLRELMELYTFEDDAFDTRRVDELQRELDVLPATRDERDS
jgi:hypothetical protein